MRMKTMLGLLALAGVASAALGVGSALADQGSGASAANRNDNFVVICHYDRNQQGPNAGPHTIAINIHALDHHLENHVKKDGFVGDDHVGACTEPTPPATNTAVPPTNTPPATNTPTSTPTPGATRTAAATRTAGATETTTVTSVAGCVTFDPWGC